MEGDNDNNEAGAPKTYLTLMMADDYKSTVTKSISRPPRIMSLKQLAKPGIRRTLDVKFKRASELSGREFKLTPAKRQAVEAWQEHLYDNSSFIEDGLKTARISLQEFVKTRDFTTLAILTEELNDVDALVRPKPASFYEAERSLAVRDAYDALMVKLNAIGAGDETKTLANNLMQAACIGRTK
jgi:hypothetical protein